MIRLFQRLLLFSGLQKKRLIRSFLAYLVSSFFEMIPIMAILTVLTGILKQLSGDVMPESTIWISLGIMIVSIVGRIVFVNLSANARTLGSFAFGSEKRMEIGERLKKAPMGYFNENRLGDITAAVTTTLGDLEQQSVTIMENVAGGFIHAIVIGVWLMIYEWRIGLISLAGLAVALIVYSFIGKVGRKYAPRRQAAQAGLVTAVLEYVQGMGVVKAFGLAERTGKAVDAAIEESKEANIVLEKAFSKMTALYQTVFKLARAAILVFAPYLLAGGSITPEKCLLLLVSSFMIYAAVEVAGSMSSIARAVEASLDRLDNIMDIPSLDENGADLVPENFNIEVKNMSFGYEEKEVLHQISLSVPQGSSCAIVGPSGAGKTTLVGLIARFWDVKEGQITLGGRDVREYTSGSLLKNFAIVFQNVYLFEDTVENNIRFGRPDASEDEIIFGDYLPARSAWSYAGKIQARMQIIQISKEGEENLRLKTPLSDKDLLYEPVGEYQFYCAEAIPEERSLAFSVLDGRVTSMTFRLAHDYVPAGPLNGFAGSFLSLGSYILLMVLWLAILIILGSKIVCKRSSFQWQRIILPICGLILGAAGIAGMFHWFSLYTIISTELNIVAGIGIAAAICGIFTGFSYVVKRKNRASVLTIVLFALQIISAWMLGFLTVV